MSDLTDEELVEAVAKAIIQADYPAIAWGLIRGASREKRMNQARAAIAAAYPVIAHTVAEECAQIVANVIIRAAWPAPTTPEGQNNG